MPSFAAARAATAVGVNQSRLLDGAVGSYIVDVGCGENPGEVQGFETVPDEGPARLGGETSSPIGTVQVEGQHGLSRGNVAVAQSMGIETAATDVSSLRFEHGGHQAEGFGGKKVLAEVSFQFALGEHRLWRAIKGIRFHGAVGLQIGRKVRTEQQTFSFELGHGA